MNELFLIPEKKHIRYQIVQYFLLQRTRNQYFVLPFQHSHYQATLQMNCLKSRICKFILTCTQNHFLAQSQFEANSKPAQSQLKEQANITTIDSQVMLGVCRLHNCPDHFYYKKRRCLMMFCNAIAQYKTLPIPHTVILASLW